MAFQKYKPNFKTVDEIRSELVENGFFEKGKLTDKEMYLALEVLIHKHKIGFGPSGYETSEKHLAALAQYIDSDYAYSCVVDVS